MQKLNKIPSSQDDEFHRLYHILNKMVDNNKEPNKIISIDTDQVMNPLFSTVEKQETNKKEEATLATVPSRVLPIDDSPVSTMISPIQYEKPKEQEKKQTDPKQVMNLGIDLVFQKEKGGISISSSQPSFSFHIPSSIQDQNMKIHIGIDVLSHSNHTMFPAIHQSSESSGSSKYSTEKDTVDAIETIEPVQLVGHLEPIEPIESIEPIEPIEPKRELVIGSESSTVIQPTCKACKKIFTQYKCLKNHLKNYPVCQEWIKHYEKENTILPKKGIYYMVEEYMEKIIEGDQSNQCRFCKNVFPHRSAHHKHYQNHMTCNRMAFMEFMKQINSLNT
jgi:hypothetical protein